MNNNKFEKNNNNQMNLNYSDNTINNKFASPIEAELSEVNEMKMFAGRNLSPAVLAKSIQISRTIPLPGAQKRTPHL